MKLIEIILPEFLTKQSLANPNLWTHNEGESIGNDNVYKGTQV